MKSATPTHLGGYRVEEVLGKGGMGEVFLARDGRLGRRVALKRIRPDRAVDAQQRKRFRREARAVARLNHPAIVQIHDIFETDGGDCIVMEYVEGKSLAELVARGPLELELAVRLAGEIADGLAEAHTKGLVHRDLKPENVVITSSGRVKILDFGLARALWGDEVPGEAEATKLTEPGTLVGTVYAMSPEQAGGRPVDHRSDLFALGGLLYEMLTGRAPFRGSNLLDTLRRVLSEEPRPLAQLRPGLPPELVDLVGRLLAKDPLKRPANARLVREELEKMQVVAGRQGSENLPTTSFPGLPAPGGAGAVPADGDAVVRVLVMTDLVDSTRLIGKLGDERAFELTGRHDRAARDLLKRHGGLEIDKSDGFLLLFERPVEAVAYALAYHDALEELSAEDDVELAARVGIHLGEVRLRHNAPDDVSRGAKPLEVEGLAKPTTARLMSLAGGRQTLLTGAAFDLARRAAADAELDGGELTWLAHGAYLFQGVEEPAEIFEVGREGLAPLAEPEDSEKARRDVAIHDEHTLGWRPAAGQAIPRRPNWTLAERVGEGGFGEVWLAAHKSGEKRVFKFCFEAERLRSLKREVTLFRLLKEALGHREDIARILDWNFERAPFYLEAEYTEGGNLAEWIERQGGIGKVPMPTRLELVAQVAEALAAAHSVGILHKDVKPENVLVTSDREGRPRALLTDFGIGLLTEPQRLAVPGITAMGFTATMSPTGSSEGGTLVYMAPELIEGKTATVQADIYSLGVMLYQLVAGSFGRALAPGWRRDVGDELLAEDIASFVDGLAERRPASALEVAERLRRLESRRVACEAERRAQEQAQAQRSALAKAQRRRKLFASIAATAIVVLAVVSAFTVQATKQRQRADLRREQAEKLVNFMLGDLIEKIEPIGRLDVFSDVSDETLRYFASIPEEELTNNDFFQRSKALRYIGWVHLEQGDSEPAMTFFQEALAILEKLTEIDTNQREWSEDFALAHFLIGNIFWIREDLDGALKCFQEQLSTLDRLAERNPTDLDLQQALVGAYSNLAFVQGRRGDWKGALIAHLGTLETLRQLQIKDSENTGIQLHLGEQERNVGLALLEIGEIDRALEHFYTGQEILEKLIARDSENVEWKLELARSNGSLGATLDAKGRTEEARKHFKNKLSIATGLLEVDPNQTKWHELHAIARRQFSFYLYQTDPDAASRMLQESLKEIDNLVRKDSTNITWKKDAAICRIAWGNLLASREDLKEAQRMAQAAIQSLQLLSQNSPNESSYDLWLAEAHVLLGKTYSASGKRHHAREAWGQAADIIESVALNSNHPRALDIWVRVLLFLHRNDEAEEAMRRLAAIGCEFSEGGNVL